METIKRIIAIVLIVPPLLLGTGGCANLLQCGSLNCEEDGYRDLLLLAGLLGGACKQAVSNSSVETEDVSRYRSSLGSEIITNERWNESAVRMVLHAFAYGGPATDAQISAWADMAPELAIREILTFNPINSKLSPSYGDFGMTDGRMGSLSCLSGFFASSHPGNPTPPNARSGMRLEIGGSGGAIWSMASMTRGLNPVRQKIGLWETNYHLAINTAGLVSNVQSVDYYDTVMNGLVAGDAYESVLAKAALSAAIATQYNHRENVFTNGTFAGNEDFGREFHQLFFGILGDTDPGHETGTIPQTSRALTDMAVSNTGAGIEITYGTLEHFQGTTTILGSAISGNTAEERMTTAASVAIQHSESIKRLPIIIAKGLADDTLDPEIVTGGSREEKIRAIWNSMSQKNLLDFLRMYAISNAFHTSARQKYLTSFDRNVMINNLLVVNNEELRLGLYGPDGGFALEEVAVFQPVHNVFGHQTGEEASLTSAVFMSAYNTAVQNSSYAPGAIGGRWTKDWSLVIPRENGAHRVKFTAEWLWRRFVNDDLSNFGTLERAHVYALLASGTDFAFWIDPTHPETQYTEAEILADVTIQNRLTDVQAAVIQLDSMDSRTRADANQAIGLAINFISATPYIFAHQGKDL